MINSEWSCDDKCVVFNIKQVKLFSCNNNAKSWTYQGFFLLLSSLRNLELEEMKQMTISLVLISFENCKFDQAYKVIKKFENKIDFSLFIINLIAV